MKKNAMLKIAAILMVAVLLTTCAISSTFAKYVSTGKTTSSARVAKWGVDLTVSANNSAFLQNYGSGLVASDTYVVAPGTSVDNAVTVTVTGTPEVKTKVVITDTKPVGQDETPTKNFISLTNWEIDHPTEGDIEYCPVVFVINGSKYALDDSGLTASTQDKIYISTDVADLMTDINAAIAGAFGTAYNAQTSVEQSLTIGWYWNFSIDDVKDTLLGDVAADNTANAPKIDFAFDITIEQDGPASPNK